MHSAVKLTCVGMLALVAGCSSLNPFSGKSKPRNPPAALEDFRPTLTVRTAWSAKVGSAGAYTFTPALAGDSIFVAGADGTLARFNAGNGQSIWRINAGASLTAGVGTDGITVAVAAEQGTIMAFDVNGKARWTAQASSEILSAPAVGQGLVIVRSIDNRIAAFDAESGVRRWVLQRPTPPLTLRSAPGIVITETTGYVALPGGRLLAVALGNGGVRWEVVVGDPRGATEIERIADLSGNPVVVGSDICAVAYQGRVGCFDLVTGAPRWGQETSSEVGVGADERFVYVADERGTVSAFSRDAGVRAWRNNRLANRRLASPVPVGSAVAIGDGQGYVHFLARDDGALVARTSTDGSRVQAAVQLRPGRSAVFQTQAGTVVALATE